MAKSGYGQTPDATDVGASGGAMTEQEYMVFTGTGGPVGQFNETSSRYKQGYQDYVNDVNALRDSGDMDFAQVKHDQAVATYGERPDAYTYGSGGQEQYKADMATYMSKIEASETAADFRKEAYESYRNKYLQHSGTALGTSNSSSQAVVIG